MARISFTLLKNHTSASTIEEIIKARCKTLAKTMQEEVRSVMDRFTSG